MDMLARLDSDRAALKQANLQLQAQLDGLSRLNIGDTCNRVRTVWFGDIVLKGISHVGVPECKLRYQTAETALLLAPMA